MWEKFDIRPRKIFLFTLHNSMLKDVYPAVNARNPLNLKTSQVYLDEAVSYGLDLSLK